VYPAVANGEGGVTKLLRTPYFSVSVQFVPEAGFMLKETSVTCKVREVSSPHRSVVPSQTDAQPAQVTICA